MPRAAVAYPLHARQIEAVATAADLSPRTVRRYLAGLSMLGSTMRRVERVLRAAGLEAVVRATPAARAA